jgi:hypothetical protein
VFHAPRLWEFAGLLGDNGVTQNLCDGPVSVPSAVVNALSGPIDLACEEFIPPG